ncbi:hypothetical protein ACN20G_25415 [Streptomyces sp. BI20]|uniref:glycosyltransferase family 39 protein n=1 Tax=Streptomyces sp. BI20 TaxID=3403460 RepID=UPI003C752A16
MTPAPPARARRLPYRPPLWPVTVLWTLALGLWGLDRGHSLWRDEAATWQVALRPTGEITHLLGQVDAVHGLHYLLVHAVFEVFGPSTTALRLPSVLAFCVTAGLVTVLGQRLSGRATGLAAGLLLGLLPAVQFQLQEGRAYALVTACVTAAGLLLVTALRRPPRSSPSPSRRRCAHWSLWPGYAALVLVAALLNWLSLLVLPAHALTLALARAPRAVWTRWCAAAAAAGAGAAPLVWFSRTQSGQVSWIPALTWQALLGPAALCALGAFGAWADGRARRAGPAGPGARPAGGPSLAAFALPLLTVPFALLALVSLVQPVFLDRYVLFTMVGLALSLGALLAAAARTVARRHPLTARLLVPVVVLLVFAAMLPTQLANRSPASRVDDVFSAAERVARVKRPGDAVLFVPAARRDTALVSPAAFRGLADVALARSPIASGTLKGEESAPAEIRRALLARQRVVLVSDAGKAAARPAGAERDRVKLTTLREHFRLVSDESARGRRVSVWERLPGH